eukprot:gene3278-6490_t
MIVPVTVLLISIQPLKVSGFFKPTFNAKIIVPINRHIEAFTSNLNYPSLNFPSNSRLNQSTIGSSDDFQIRKDLNSIIQRLDKLEKTVSSAQLVKNKTPVEHLLNSLTANTFAINPKNVEVCSIISFFFIGIIVGASLLDRLWLLGGIVASLWASGAVNRDTRGGAIARRVGVESAQVIRELQEKYNQLIVFYRTGQLAYLSSKTWDQYDQYFGLTKNIDMWKKIAIERATEFNSAFKEYKFVDQMNDMWNVLMKAPFEAKRIDEEYGVTESIYSFTRGFVSSTKDFLFNMVDRGRENNENHNYKYNKKYSLHNNKRWNFPWSRQKSKRTVINPWESPFKSIMSSSSSSSTSSQKKRGIGRITRLNSHSPYVTTQSTHTSYNDIPYPSTISSSTSSSRYTSSTSTSKKSLLKNKKFLEINSLRMKNNLLFRTSMTLKYMIAAVISPVSQFSSKEEALRLWRRESIRGLVRHHIAHSLF